MRIITGPRAKIKIVVSNHNLKEDRFNKPKLCHWDQTEKGHQFNLCFSKLAVIYYQKSILVKGHYIVNILLNTIDDKQILIIYL